MGSLALKRSSGLRRYDGFSAAAERIAAEWQGQADASPARLLGKLKRAAPYMGIPRALVSMLDELVAHSRPQDWRPGKTPIVWVRNETLAVTLGVGVRQLQNYIRRSVELGLIVPRDSANGHRGGARNADGEIVWAYGFDLSPIGARAAEFDTIAAEGAAIDKEIDRLRRVLASLRRKARTLAETVDAQALDVDADAVIAFVAMAVVHARGSRDPELLQTCIDQMAGEVEALQKDVDNALASRGDRASEALNISPKAESKFVDSTTTTHLKTANAVTRISSSEWSSGELDVGMLAPQSNVEADLEHYGVDPGFISMACPELLWDLEPGPRAWGRIVSVAEQLVGQNRIAIGAWREACRLMGQKGAAAAVIAAVYKNWTGEVREPGAYLRGMCAKAAGGALHLGRTYHGLREAQKAAA